jgi:hypothetical protein
MFELENIPINFKSYMMHKRQMIGFQQQT